jgi:tellurite resistance protein TerC
MPVHFEALAALIRSSSEVSPLKAADGDAWLVLSLSFAILLTGDLYFNSASNKRWTLTTAFASTGFFVLCGVAFNVYVFYQFGRESAMQWASAYCLEWLLSFDNLFVFHQIFTAYHTPSELRHRPLFIGIVCAVVLRLIALFFAEYLLHNYFFMHLVFGLFLVGTGLRAMMDDDDEEYQESWVSRKAGEYLPIVSYYDGAAFFTKVPESGESTYGTVSGQTKYSWKATTMLLVLVSVEVADIFFAIDSISAIVAQVDNLYLAYSAVVYAMLGLRSSYFMIDVLAEKFKLFKYGIAAVLVFIGLKLIFSNFIEIPAMIVLLVMPCLLGLSVVLSLVTERKSNPQEL